jgi:HSP20 family protein
MLTATTKNNTGLTKAYNPWGSLFRGNFWDTMVPEFTSTVPSANIRELKNEYQVEMAIPGMKKDDFNIDVSGNVMTIWCEKESESDTERETTGYTRREYNYSSFTRSFTLPQNANVDKVVAKYTDGMLTLNIPKKADSETNGKKIKVQ